MTDLEKYLKAVEEHYASETKQCSICGVEFTGWGNNALPVYDGLCCDECNISVVIPLRIKNIISEEE